MCRSLTFSCYKSPRREGLNTFSNFVCNFSTSVVRIIETAIIGKILVPDRREGRKTKTRG